MLAVRSNGSALRRGKPSVTSNGGLYVHSAPHHPHRDLLLRSGPRRMRKEGERLRRQYERNGVLHFLHHHLHHHDSGPTQPGRRRRQVEHAIRSHERRHIRDHLRLDCDGEHVRLEHDISGASNTGTSESQRRRRQHHVGRRPILECSAEGSPGHDVRRFTTSGWKHRGQHHRTL